MTLQQIKCDKCGQILPPSTIYYTVKAGGEVTPIYYCEPDYASYSDTDVQAKLNSFGNALIQKLITAEGA